MPHQQFLPDKIYIYGEYIKWNTTTIFNSKLGRENKPLDISFNKHRKRKLIENSVELGKIKKE